MVKQLVLYVKCLDAKENATVDLVFVYTMFEIYEKKLYFIHDAFIFRL